MLKLLAYIVLTFSLLLTVLFPTYLLAVGSYASPTATYAHALVSATTVPAGRDYWSYALMVEIEYPAPSMLLAIYGEVTGFPMELRMYQPIIGLTSLVYFVFALKAISLGKIKREYAALLASIYYLFIVSDRLIAHYVGRAAFGVVALVYFFLALLVYKDHADGRKQGGLVSLMLLAALLGYTYYTSALAAFLVCLLLYPLTQLANSNDRNRSKKRYRDLTVVPLLITVITIVRMVSTTGLLADLSLIRFYENLLDYIKAQLKIERTSEAYFLHVGFAGEVSPIIRVTQLWLRNFIRLLAAAAISLSFSKMFLRLLLNRKDMNSLSEYIAAAFICCCAELAYTFLAPTFSLRFFTIFGLPALIYVMYRIFTSKINNVNLRNKISHVASLLLLGLMFIVGMSSIIFIWQEEIEHVKAHGYEKVQGLVKYLALAGSSGGGIRVAGDAYYSAILHYLLRINNSGVIAEPLGSSSVALYHACKDVSHYEEAKHHLLSRWLLLQKETIFGDAWGYAVRIQRCDHILSALNLVYSDIRFTLLAQ